ncbi:hypothetical protein BWI15_06610 [Kribbella sp. ALI-6-A]|uniref:hypothetical protein n=1 Tax=Kribbella sp. ALI-6-A TaxID=1933817 RepID=UPI00097C0D18|nr:hypothetical protein [Kribbella sp. ALI-6-A]ONI75516.1 hypothetical protein BWI15_06610 [Kribbella sp. ALI-6-A]
MAVGTQDDVRRPQAEPPGWVEGTLRVLGTGLLGIWHLRPSARRARADRRTTCGGCRKRHRRLLRALGGLVALQVVGIAGLVAFGLGAPVCPPPPTLNREEAIAYTTAGEGPWLRTRQVLTSGQTGLALLWARTRDADVCRFAPNGTLVARMESGYARGGTMYGHAFLTSPGQDRTYAELVPIKRHESRHTVQWTVGTALAGPLGFPVAYSLDELFAPGAHNHFERAAGLTDGGYAAPDTPPPTVVRVFLVLVLLGVVTFERHRLGRQLTLLRAHLEHQRRRRPGTGLAATLAEHRRLRQIGCPSCGDLSPGAGSGSPSAG